ncbi:Peptidoglycan-binding Lysin subgroup [Botryosphaeria dothidea]|uniref:Peptidoglycan-binding Lysin subgroup n=1 Tax=Botryosphaeria dothidea TaxID=55169 RepID=A0A8H4IMX8_9PEZI|nr:Peptidoglycan-binding Lysin subgroup [Botryosphaeria dothidea]
MFSVPIIGATLALIGSVAASPYAYHGIASRQTQLCNGTIILNTTSTTYTVQPDDTLIGIANAFNRGVCDIARANAIADVDVLFADQVLAIPPQVCNPDNTTCLIDTTPPTATCIAGGPGFYTVVSGDTLTRIAEDKFNITLQSLIAANTANIPDPDLIEVGQLVNVPVCPETQCFIQPYVYRNSSLVQLAHDYETTVGQILSLNANFNGTGVPTAGQNITLPSRCGAYPAYPSKK